MMLNEGWTIRVSVVCSWKCTKCVKYYISGVHSRRNRPVSRPVSKSVEFFFFCNWILMVTRFRKMCLRLMRHCRAALEFCLCRLTCLLPLLVRDGWISPCIPFANTCGSPTDREVRGPWQKGQENSRG